MSQHTPEVSQEEMDTHQQKVHEYFQSITEQLDVAEPTVALDTLLNLLQYYIQQTPTLGSAHELTQGCVRELYRSYFDLETRSLAAHNEEETA